MVAFPYLIYKATGSALSTGAVLALYTLPYVLFGVFAGVAIDRVNKRTVMVAVDLARAALVLGVPLVAERSLIAVYILTFATASLGVFFDPCKLSILPDLVARTQLVRANSLLVTGDNLTDVVGFAAAGFIVYGFSTTAVFGIDAATFLVSAVALAAMSYSWVRPPAAAFRSPGVWQEAREGMRYLFHHRGLTANTLMVVVVTLGVGAAYPLTFLYAMEVVGGGTRTFGLLEAAIGAGSLLGALAMAGLGNRVRKGLAMTGGIAVLGAAFAWIGAIDEAALAMVAFFVLGLADAAVMISIDTYVQQTVPEQIRGRVWTARFTLTQSVFAFSVLAGGAAAGLIDVQTLFVICGVIVAVPALVGIFIPAVRRT
jgi:MFS family permease